MKMTFSSLGHNRCCFVDLTDVTLAFKDANSKLVDIVTVADFDIINIITK